MSDFTTILSDAQHAGTELIGFAGAARAIWEDPNLDNVARGLKSGGHAAMAVLELKASIQESFGEAVPAGAGALMPQALQIPKLAMGILPGAATMAAAAPVLAIASVGLGLINVGVGIYNAYQLRQVRKEMEAGFTQVQRALQIQSTQLSLLHAGLADVNYRLDVLRQEVHQGFATVRDDLLSLEARRRADEYHERVNLLLQNQEEITLTLADGDQPHPDDLTRLTTAGQNLVAWVDAQLRNFPPGTPSRLGLFVAKALALRSLADAAAFERGAPSRAASRRLEALIEELSHEVWAIVDGSTLHHIAVELPDVIAQYVYLRRGLLAGTAPTSEGTTVADWDDGLSAMRLLFADAPEGTTDISIPIATLQDLAWYVEWSEADAAQADLRGVDAVSLNGICRRLGAAGRPSELSPRALATLLTIALPRYADGACQTFVGEFAWERKPVVLSVAPTTVSVAPTIVSESSWVWAPVAVRAAALMTISFVPEKENIRIHRLMTNFPKWKIFLQRSDDRTSFSPKDNFYCISCGKLHNQGIEVKCSCGRPNIENPTPERPLICLRCGKSNRSAATLRMDCKNCSGSNFVNIDTILRTRVKFE